MLNKNHFCTREKVCEEMFAQAVAVVIAAAVVVVARTVLSLVVAESMIMILMLYL